MTGEFVVFHSLRPVRFARMLTRVSLTSTGFAVPMSFNLFVKKSKKRPPTP
jgi:hypothetical protein